ncbi:MAG: WS/DGAT domain-containing protein, partial [Myxococcota bacterium]
CFALVFKVHHAYMDGQGGVRIFEGALSDSPEDTVIRPFWQPSSHRPRPSGGRSRKRGERAQERRNAGLRRAVSDLAGQLGALPRLARELLEAGAEGLGLRPRSRSLPFTAPRTRLNEPVASSARRFGCCDLPLDVVRVVGAAHHATLNDVVMCVIDAGLERTLAELDATPDAPLVALMPLSLRAADHDAASNQVAALPVSLGAPDADVGERLRQIVASTRAVKQRARRTPGSLLQGYTTFVASSAALLDALPGLAGALPSFNLILSNVRGPKRRLHLNGAPLLGAYALPIVPPGAALNVTVFSYADSICLGVGTTPASLPDTERLVDNIEAALGELAHGLPAASA